MGAKKTSKSIGLYLKYKTEILYLPLFHVNTTMKEAIAGIVPLTHQK